MVVRRVARRGLWLAALLVAAAGTLTPHRHADHLRERVLHGLGLSRLPDPAKMNISQEEYERMHRVYLQRVTESRGPHSNTVQHFYTITHQGEVRQVAAGGAAWLYYPVSARLAAGADVDHAVLRLLVSADRPQGAHLAAYQLLERGPGAEARRLLDRRPVSTAAPTWTELDVTPAVQAWLARNSSNLGLQLACEGCAPAFAARRPPVLNVMTNAHARGRGRRSPPAAAHRSGGCRKDQKCCRHSMQVVFNEIKGFDFIVQPKMFDAGFCKGKCPPSFNPAHHHALFQSLIWKKNRQRAPKLCCAPYQLSSLEVLHRDESDDTKLKVSKWEGMSVIDCKCS